MSPFKRLYDGLRAIFYFATENLYLRVPVASCASRTFLRKGRKMKHTWSCLDHTVVVCEACLVLTVEAKLIFYGRLSFVLIQ